MNTEDLTPQTQAEIAAIVFESQEKDRWLTAHSFVYRHIGGFMGLSFGMMFACLAGLLIGRYDPDHLWRMYLYLFLGYGGILMLFVTLTRPDSKNIFTTILKVVVGFTLLITVLVPIYVGFLYLVGWVIS